MSKKKQIKQEEIIEQVSANVQEAEAKQPEPIYLRDTLLGMSEIQAFGLNRHFLCAILKDKFYTLEDAKRLIRSVL